VTELLLVRKNAPAVERRIVEHGGELHAPHLIDVEVLSALRLLVASGAATSERASEAVDDLQDLRIERYAHEPLVPRVWAFRQKFSAYDAVYVALAEALADDGIPLLTADGRLARAIERHADVEPLLAR
jgi:predicted nucleic acid-binding protein